MGAWGEKVFEDDQVCDALDDIFRWSDLLEKQDHPSDVFDDAIKTSGYILPKVYRKCYDISLVMKKMPTLSKHEQKAIKADPGECGPEDWASYWLALITLHCDNKLPISAKLFKNGSMAIEWFIKDADDYSNPDKRRKHLKSILKQAEKLRSKNKE